MSEILEFYKGAAIYEAEPFDEEKGEKMNVKLIAKAVLPEPHNVKVDFTEEAMNQEKAIKKIHNAIDKYLDHHDLRRFKNNE